MYILEFNRGTYTNIMNNALKSLENNALAALTQRAPQGIINAIKTASAKTGVSFSYLMEKAAVESNFNPTIKAKSSSATGLFQFIDSTWMNMIDKFGDKYGINTHQSKQQLLNLRKDPEISSLMAAEFAQDNKAYLQQTVGGDIGNTELYFAHFMGAGGASAFLSQLHKNPNALAADIFPKEANANRGVFYNKNGSQRTLSQIYDFFDKKFSGDTSVATISEKTPHRVSKNSIRGQGYQHIPFSLKQPIEILAQETSSKNRNSIFALRNQIDAFFSQPNTDLYQMGSVSPYNQMNNQASVLLDILK